MIAVIAAGKRQDFGHLWEDCFKCFGLLVEGYRDRVGARSVDLVIGASGDRKGKTSEPYANLGGLGMRWDE